MVKHSISNLDHMDCCSFLDSFPYPFLSFHVHCSLLAVQSFVGVDTVEVVVV